MPSTRLALCTLSALSRRGFQVETNTARRELPVSVISVGKIARDASFDWTNDSLLMWIARKISSPPYITLGILRYKDAPWPAILAHEICKCNALRKSHSGKT